MRPLPDRPEDVTLDVHRLHCQEAYSYVMTTTKVRLRTELTTSPLTLSILSRKQWGSIWMKPGHSNKIAILCVAGEIGRSKES